MRVTETYLEAVRIYNKTHDSKWDIPLHPVPKDRKSYRRRAIRHWGDDCVCCGAPSVHVHHIVPRAHGGGHHPDNLIPVCLACHIEFHPNLVPKQRPSRIDGCSSVVVDCKWIAVSTLQNA
jgi:5-methylcytosine-specific restriction endonuclease McrA